MAVCQVCQHDNPPGAEFCEECGAALSQTNAPVGAAVPVQSSPAAGPNATAPEGATSPAPGPGATTPPASEPVGSGDAPTSTSIPAETPAPAPAAETSTPAPDGVGKGARLVAMRFGAPTGEEIPLLGQRLVVGRFDPETGPVDIDLSSTTDAGHISRQHAELYQENGQWVVRDLGSTNGVFVKGSGSTSFGPRITAPRPLAEGDEVAFGNSRFVFRTS